MSQKLNKTKQKQHELIAQDIQTRTFELGLRNFNIERWMITKTIINKENITIRGQILCKF